MSFRTHQYDPNLSSICTCLTLKKKKKEKIMPLFFLDFPDPYLMFLVTISGSPFSFPTLTCSLPFCSSPSPLVLCILFPSKHCHHLFLCCNDSTLSLKSLFCSMVFNICLTKYATLLCSPVSVLGPWVESLSCVSDYKDFMTVGIIYKASTTQ